MQILKLLEDWRSMYSILVLMTHQIIQCFTYIHFIYWVKPFKVPRMGQRVSTVGKALMHSWTGFNPQLPIWFTRSFNFGDPMLCVVLSRPTALFLKLLLQIDLYSNIRNSAEVWLKEILMRFDWYSHGRQRKAGAWGLRLIPLILFQGC